jgi:hypothetical protein
VVSEPAVYRVLVSRTAGRLLAEVPGVAGTRVWAWDLPSLERLVRDVLGEALSLSADARERLLLQWD